MWRLAARAALKKRGLRSEWLRECALCLFALLVFGLLSQTLLCEFTLRDGVPAVAAAGHGKVRLIPGRVIYDSVRKLLRRHNIGYFLINFVGNIALFLPLGFFPPLLWQNVSLKSAALIGFAVSAFIELCQLPLPRDFDVDDLILNTLGAVLGWLLTRAVRRRFPALCARLRCAREQDSRNN